jgi:hypothetical protein
MKEKDIENLIAQHPEDFFPKAGFKLVGQQVQLGSLRADIIFIDKYDRRIIIEVKLGILSRDAAGQILDYYGQIKNSAPSQFIELILCANIIPTERRTFLENSGIECKELGNAKIVEVAKKYGYAFIDERKSMPLALPDIAVTKSSEIIDKQVWIFQANPKLYDIWNALQDQEAINDFHWTVNQHKTDIKNGDIALIWMSGKEAGIYAIADITSNPYEGYESSADTRHWQKSEDRGKMRLLVKCRFSTMLINDPLLRCSIKTNEELSKLSILRQAQGTNFVVSNSEWSVLCRMLRKDNDNVK